MRKPRAIIGSDGLLGFGLNKVHPRMIGTFPRVLCKYVREDRVRLAV
jgi:N-acyl-D-aspartate/D-glutamate deacylase